MVVFSCENILLVAFNSAKEPSYVEIISLLLTSADFSLFISSLSSLSCFVNMSASVYDLSILFCILFCSFCILSLDSWLNSMHWSFGIVMVLLFVFKLALVSFVLGFVLGFALTFRFADVIEAKIFYPLS
jgi:hypothetical protein